MGERAPLFAAAVQERERDQRPADTTEIVELSSQLDELINSHEVSRTAIVASDQFSEWFKVGSYASMCERYIDESPVIEIQLQVRRDRSLYGETFTVLVEHQVHRSELIDNTLAKVYSLMVPDDLESEDPKLLVCYQQSPLIGVGRSLAPVTPDTIMSSEHEADRQLNREFYNWHVCSAYEAGELAQDLAFINSSSMRGSK